MPELEGKSPTLAIAPFTEGDHRPRKEQGLGQGHRRSKPASVAGFVTQPAALSPTAHTWRPSVPGRGLFTEKHGFLIYVGGSSSSPTDGFALPSGLFFLQQPGDAVALCGGWAARKASLYAAEPLLLSERLVGALWDRGACRPEAHRPAPHKADSRTVS